MGLIKTWKGITALDYEGAREEFERVRGDFPIHQILIDNL